LGAGTLLLIFLAVAITQLRKETSPPGRLIPFDGRKVHLFCEGTGAPTVIIEASSSTPARIWRGVQDAIATFTHVCAYDRAGYGWSDPATKPRSMQDRAEELHSVLKTAGEKAPFVFVAHSYGGFLARLFRNRHPQEVRGMVLVDAVEEGNFFSPAAVARWDVIGSKLEEAKAKAGPTQAVFYDAVLDELASDRLVPESMRKIGGFGKLGDLPLVVIAHNKPFAGDDAPMEPGWRAGEERLAGLSSQGKLIIATNSDHNIENSEPELIVSAIRDMVGEVQSPVR
jgi:pimeloyl-ACP methyl ester carboxylesterase